MSKNSVEQWQQKIDEHFGSGKYKMLTANTIVNGVEMGAQIECLKCHNVITYKDIRHYYRRKTLCSCWKEDKSNCDGVKDIQKKIDEKFGVGEFTVLDLKRETDKITVKHKCGFIRTIDRYRFYQRGLCPQCDKAISKGEKDIASILLDLKIPFETQKTFPDLVSANERYLRFDFFVDNKFIIEFNGAQHYEPIEHFGGEERFEERQFYDSLKEDYCKEKNIPILIIPYWEVKNMKNTIISFLKSNDYPVRE